MADQYGLIFKIRFGTKSAVVISNHKAVKECFTTNDKALAGRPRSSQGKYLGYNYAVFGFINYGKFWLKMRKITMLELLSSRRLETLKNVQVIEVDTLIKNLYSLRKCNEPNNQAKVVISECIEHLTFNIITKMIVGKRYFGNLNDGNDGEALRIRKIIKEFMHVFGVPVVSDVVPFLGGLEFFLGQVKYIKKIGRELDTLVGSWVEEHTLRRAKSEPIDKPDFIDVMLSVIEDDGMFGHSRETIIKATIVVCFGYILL